MIRFYFHPTPNPAKVALMLEETSLAYQLDRYDGGRHYDQGELSLNNRCRYQSTDFFTQKRSRTFVLTKEARSGGNEYFSPEAIKIRALLPV
jgi:hypothetical protein